jgi:hypothetical protein
LELVWSVRVQELLDHLFVLHLVVDIAVAHRRGGGNVGSSVVLASVPSCVVPLKVKGGGGRGWGRGIARLREAVAASDAVEARLALGWIVNHVCELGLGMCFLFGRGIGSIKGQRGEKGERKYLKIGDIHSLL